VTPRGWATIDDGAAAKPGQDAGTPGAITRYESPDQDPSRAVTSHRTSSWVPPGRPHVRQPLLPHQRPHGVARGAGGQDGGGIAAEVQDLRDGKVKSCRGRHVPLFVSSVSDSKLHRSALSFLSDGPP
jgi:hypothetical protein